MSYQADTLEILAKEFARALAPLVSALESPRAIRQLISNLGWELPEDVESLGLDPAVLDSVVSAVDVLIRKELGDAEDSATDSDYATLLSAISSFVIHVYELPSTLPAHLDAAFLSASGMATSFPGRLLDYLIVEWIYQAERPLFYALVTLGIIELRSFPRDTATFTSAHTRRTLRLDRAQLLISDPRSLPSEVYGWGTATAELDLLLERLRDLLIAMGAPISWGAPDLIKEINLSSPASVLTEGKVQRSELCVWVYRSEDPQVSAEIGVTLFPVPPLEEDGAPGLSLCLYVIGGEIRTVPLDDRHRWLLALTSELDLLLGIGIIARHGERLKIITDLLSAGTAALGTVDAEIRWQSLADETVRLLALADRCSLSTHAFYVKGGLALSLSGDAELFAEIGLDNAQMHLALDEGDSFLKSFSPAGGIDADFDLGVGISSRRGLYLRGSTGLETSIINHQALGPLNLQSIDLAIKPDSDGIDLDVAITAKAQLGPLLITIKSVGFKTRLGLPDHGGNLGPVQFDLSFKSPNGIGLNIDGGGFKGGGFLDFDATNRRYSGALVLEYEDRISLNAIGIITTQLPDGSSGYSLLIVITSEFNPVQLGLGFTLNGVGGLLGLNRTADVERLRRGLRDKTLDSVLFPQNAITNADRILSDLAQVFPFQADRFIFGPMARIGWGTPTLITADVGLLIEIPDPIRVLILGVVKAILPDEDKRILQLHVDFLGVIDFQAQQFAFDASLYDSKLLRYPLSGDMTVRLNWGGERNFLLSVGGFHPAYQPPPLNLPTLRRLSLQLISEDNLRLGLEAYFAVTSNTIQFGAKAELYASAGPFNVYGFASLDVLFQRHPFYFIASIQATLALRKGSSTIASIACTFTLEGTTPWHVNGIASLRVGWFLTISVPFNKTWGNPLTTTLEDIPVLPLLRQALGEPGNWKAQIPDNRHVLVSFKEIQSAGDQVIVYPFGVLTIQQKIVPLKIDIQKFGSQHPSDGNNFAIGPVWVGTRELGINDIQEFFAPAQFFEMSDAEKLSRKSFERYNSGVKLTDFEALSGDYAVSRKIEYELKYIDDQRNVLTSPKFLAPDYAAFDIWAVQGAIANSSLSFARNARSALAPEEVRVTQEEYAVVNVNDLHLATTDALATSEAGALSLMNAMIRDNPALEGAIQVVPFFEVNMS